MKFEVQGVGLKNKRINLNPFNNFLVSKQEQLKSSWMIFKESNIKQLEDMSLLKKEISFINKVFDVKDAGRFGYLIETKHKKTYEDLIMRVNHDFKCYMIEEELEQPNIFIRQNSDISGEKIDLSTIIEENRKGLIQYLITIAKTETNFIKVVKNQRRDLCRKLKDEEIVEDQAIEAFISQFIDNDLKYPAASELYDRIDVKVDYYDISDELLYSNQDFKELIKEYNLDEKMRIYEEGRAIETVST